MIGKLASPDSSFDVCVVILLSSCRFSFHFLFCIVAAEFRADAVLWVVDMVGSF
jgi:hypothetical protein